MKLKPLDAEQHRVLLKRMIAAIEKARYHPAETQDHEAVAREVLRPVEPKAGG